MIPTFSGFFELFFNISYFWTPFIFPFFTFFFFFLELWFFHELHFGFWNFVLISKMRSCFFINCFAFLIVE